MLANVPIPQATDNLHKQDVQAIAERTSLLLRHQPAEYTLGRYIEDVFGRATKTWSDIAPGRSLQDVLVHHGSLIVE